MNSVEKYIFENYRALVENAGFSVYYVEFQKSHKDSMHDHCHGRCLKLVFLVIIFYHRNILCDLLLLRRPCGQNHLEVVLVCNIQNFHNILVWNGFVCIQ